MAWNARHYGAEQPEEVDANRRPLVTIQLPIYNEKYVVNRLIAAVAAQQYPRDMIDIQVLDDSSDETTALAQKAVIDLKSSGFTIDLIHRDNRVGYKGGALDNGIATAKGEFIAIFDADFIPPPDFLNNTIPTLLNNPDTAWVQARWEHINRNYSWLTEALAFGIDGHFFIEQTSRNAEHLTTNFCGTCGVIRKKAIQDVGGWSKHVLTEDLYLSYMMQLKGWKGCYLRDVAVPGEVPATVTGLKYQQGRWCTGTVQVWKLLLVDIWKSKSFSLRKKFLATIHLTYYTVHPLLFLMLITAAPLTISGAVLHHYGLWWQLLTVVATICAFATPTMYLEGARYKGLDMKRRLKSLILLTIGGYGISISNTISYLNALFGRVGEFKRTPKYSLNTKEDSWQNKRYQPSIPLSAPLELAAGVFASATFASAIMHLDLTAALFLAFYAMGYLVVGAFTVKEALVRRKLAEKAD